MMSQRTSSKQGNSTLIDLVLEVRAMVQATADSIEHLDDLFVTVQDGDISKTHVDLHHPNREEDLPHISGPEPRRSRKRRTNAFILDEAEEGEDRDTQSPSLDTST